MIHLSLYDNTDIKIDTNNYDILREIKDNFEHYEKDYFWTDKYKMGIWDGKYCLFNTARRLIPYGLTLDLYRLLRKYKNDIKMDDQIKTIFKNTVDIKNLKINYNLKYKPYDYQKICIEDAIKKTKGIYVVGTGGGKSLIISYIIKILMENKEIKKGLIIVPTLGLIEQFRNDIIDYGLSKNLIGIVNKDKKEFDFPIVISTWQTLRNKIEEIKSFDIAICDETHMAGAKEISNIMKNCKMKYKLGFTGTMQDHTLEYLKVMSYIGPIWKTYKTKWLADNGYLSHCNIVQIKINYKDKFPGDFKTFKKKVFDNEYRLNIIKEITKRKNNVLILVEKVEDEGKYIYNYLTKNIKNKEIVFLYGKDKPAIREQWRNKMENDKNIVMIATYGIFQLGINVKSIKHLIIASSSKSKIRVLQSIGRSLRKNDNKKQGAWIWDIFDMVKNLKQHGNTRERFYIKEEFKIYEVNMNEKTDKNLNKLFDLSNPLF